MSKKYNNRMTLYFSPRKDKDLIQEMENVEVGDIGWHIKGLMRDGLKYRDNNDVVDGKIDVNKWKTLFTEGKIDKVDNIEEVVTLPPEPVQQQPQQPMTSFSELDKLELKRKETAVDNLFDKL